MNRSSFAKRPSTFRGISTRQQIVFNDPSREFTRQGTVLGFRGDQVLTLLSYDDPRYVVIGIDSDGREVSVPNNSVWLVPFADIVGVADSPNDVVHRYDSTDHAKVQPYQYKYKDRSKADSWTQPTVSNKH